jgi:hypothetical protein
MIIVLHLLNDNRDRVTGFLLEFRMWRFLACPWLFVNKQGLITSVNIQYKSGCSRYNGQIFNNNQKTGKGSGHNEHHKKVNKRKTLAEKDT